MKNIEYMRLVLPIRYYEEDMPKNMPFRSGDRFEITYSVKDGKIPNYDKSKIDINYLIDWNNKEDRVDKDKLAQQSIFELNDLKVVDEGSYYILDKDFNIISSIERDYVPDSHSIDGDFGDYVNLHIDLENGTILNLKKNATFDEFLNNNEDF